MKIQMNNVTKSYAGDIVLDSLSLEIVKGSKSAIVGENGSGKTTLLKILSGQETYQEGTVAIPKEMSVGYMMQVFPNTSVTSKEFILEAFQEYILCSKRMRELEIEMCDMDTYESALESYGKTLEKFEQLVGYELENNLESYAKGLGVYEILDQPFHTLSGGQKTRIALVQLLLKDYEVLCLDEPTNHLDVDGIEWLESYCKHTDKTLVVVSHDRQFLSNVVQTFYEIEDGQIVTYFGDYETYRKERHQRYLRLVMDFEEQQKQIQKMKLAIRRFRQWGHESDNESFFKKAKAMEKRLDRVDKLPKPIEVRNQLDFKVDKSRLGSKDVVVVKDLVIGYDKALSGPLNFSVRRGDRLAIVAPNGKGKTTFLKTLMKEIEPISGSIAFGESVDVGYLPQIITFEDDKERILKYIQRVCELDEETARRSLARFGFYQNDMFKYVTHLSGGEQVRLKLLEMMMQKRNCIVLDEPTNHLDIASCEIIEEVLTKFDGTIIVISHDRMFLHTLQTEMMYL